MGIGVEGLWGGGEACVHTFRGIFLFYFPLLERIMIPFLPFRLPRCPIQFSRVLFNSASQEQCGMEALHEQIRGHRTCGFSIQLRRLIHSPPGWLWVRIANFEMKSLGTWVFYSQQGRSLYGGRVGEIASSKIMEVGSPTCVLSCFREFLFQAQKCLAVRVLNPRKPYLGGRAYYKQIKPLRSCQSEDM